MKSVEKVLIFSCLIFKCCVGDSPVTHKTLLIGNLSNVEIPGSGTSCNSLKLTENRVGNLAFLWPNTVTRF